MGVSGDRVSSLVTSLEARHPWTVVVWLLRDGTLKLGRPWFESQSHILSSMWPWASNRTSWPHFSNLQIGLIILPPSWGDCEDEVRRYVTASPYTVPSTCSLAALIPDIVDIFLSPVVTLFWTHSNCACPSSFSLSHPCFPDPLVNVAGRQGMALGRGSPSCGWWDRQLMQSPWMASRQHLSHYKCAWPVIWPFFI